MLVSFLIRRFIDHYWSLLHRESALQEAAVAREKMESANKTQTVKMYQIQEIEEPIIDEMEAERRRIDTELEELAELAAAVRANISDCSCSSDSDPSTSVVNPVNDTQSIATQSSVLKEQHMIKNGFVNEALTNVDEKMCKSSFSTEDSSVFQDREAEIDIDKNRDEVLASSSTLHSPSSIAMQTTVQCILVLSYSVSYEAFLFIFSSFSPYSL